MITDQGPTDIPLHVRRGVILPMRVSGANTTTTLRAKDFMLLVPSAPTAPRAASSTSTKVTRSCSPRHSHITFKFQHGQLKMDEQFGYDTMVKLRNIVLLQSGVAVKNITVSASLTAPLTVHVGSQRRAG
jgi:alpha-glucosidase